MELRFGTHISTNFGAKQLITISSVSKSSFNVLCKQCGANPIKLIFAFKKIQSVECTFIQ